MELVFIDEMTRNAQKKKKKKKIYCDYIHIYAESKYGMQLYINKKTGPLLWPPLTVPVRFGMLAL